MGVVVEDTNALWSWIEAHLRPKYFGQITLKIVDGCIVHVEDTNSVNLLKFSGKEEKES